MESKATNIFISKVCALDWRVKDREKYCKKQNAETNIILTCLPWLYLKKAASNSNWAIASIVIKSPIFIIDVLYFQKDIGRYNLLFYKKVYKKNQAEQCPKTTNFMRKRLNLIWLNTLSSCHLFIYLFYFCSKMKKSKRLFPNKFPEVFLNSREKPPGNSTWFFLDLPWKLHTLNPPPPFPLLGFFVK